METTTIIGERRKKYNISLHSNLSVDLGEQAVRKLLEYDDLTLLTQEDWDAACQKWIVEQLIPQSTLPIASLDFEEVKEEILS